MAMRCCTTAVVSGASASGPSGSDLQSPRSQQAALQRMLRRLRPWSGSPKRHQSCLPLKPPAQVEVRNYDSTAPRPRRHGIQQIRTEIRSGECLTLPLARRQAPRQGSIRSLTGGCAGPAADGLAWAGNVRPGGRTVLIVANTSTGWRDSCRLVGTD
jgi:hypothetical protein